MQIISQNVTFYLIGLTHQATIKQIPLNPSLTNYMTVPKAGTTHLSSSCSAPYRSVCRFQSFQLLHCSVQWQERLGLWSICSLSCRKDLVDCKSSFIITAQIQNDMSLFERKHSLRMPNLQFTLYDSFAEAAKAKSTSTSLFEQKLASSASTVFSGNLTQEESLW